MRVFYTSCLANEKMLHNKQFILSIPAFYSRISLRIENGVQPATDEKILTLSFAAI